MVFVLTVGLLVALPLGLAANPPGSAQAPPNSAAIIDPPFTAGTLAAARASLSEGHGPAHEATVECRPFSAETGCVPAAGGTTWTNLTTSSGPTSSLVSMVYDSTDGYVVLVEAGSTWSFADGQWTNRTSSLTTSPTATDGLVLADDPSDHYVVGFGGESQGSGCATNLTSVCNTTWAYEGGDWREIPTRCEYVGHGFGSCDQLQFPRSSLLMVDDPADGYVLLSAQTNGSVPGGLWSYSNGTWTDRGFNYSTNSTVSNPALGGLTYDAADGYVLGFGTNGQALGGPHGGAQSSTWEWSHDRWTNLTATVTGVPPATFDPGLAFDATDGRVVLSGGWGDVCHLWNGSYCAVATTFYRNDTWEYLAGSWTNVTAGIQPALHGGGDLAWDGGDRTVLLLSGWDCPMWSCPGRSTGSPDLYAWGSTPPIVGLTVVAGNRTPDVGVSVNFSASFLGGTPPIAFNWAFGDGNHSSGETTHHTFAVAGHFTATVWANDSAGHRTLAVAEVNVTGNLTLGISASPDPVDEGTPVQFEIAQSGGTGPFGYAWVFGDGTTSALALPIHVYSIVGIYTAELWLNDSGGASLTRTVLVYVHPALSVTFVNATPDPAELGAPVEFVGGAANGVLPYTFAWAFGDGGTGGNLANITHIFTTDGPFVATFTVSDAGGAQSSGSVNLTIALNASILSNASLGAAPLVVGFTSEVHGGTPGYEYTWQFDDGNSSTAADPAHTYTVAGRFVASLTVTDGLGRSAVSAWVVTVATGGGPLTLALASSAPNIPLGTPVLVTAEPSGGEGRYAFAWTDVPAGCTLAATLMLNCTLTSAGAFLVGATLSDAAGTITTGSVLVTVGTGGSAGPPSPPPASSTGVSSGLVVAGIAVAAVAVALGVGYGAGRRRVPEGAVASVAGPGRFAEYRATPGPRDAGPAGATAASDPLDDLF